MATSAARTIGATLVDLLEVVRGRVPLIDRDVAVATGVAEDQVAAWTDRRATPRDNEAARLGALLAVVERLEVSTKPEAIPDWLNRSVPLLDGQTPLATMAAGDYQRVAAIAEDFIYTPFT
ncbi:MAG: hypothetical protein ACRDNJ_08750 [Solirubrobacteraceae bacterium]